MTKQPLIVVCVPAFNEERRIARVILLSQEYAAKVIVCDDGSTDLTSEIAKRLGAEVIKHGENMGYGCSLRTLFGRARELNADIMVTLDADGQHDPRDIPRFMEPLLNREADIVIGSRFLDGKSSDDIPRFRRNGIKLITGVTKAVSFKEITDAQSGYRAYNRKALKTIDPTDYGMGASTEILLKAKEHALRIAEIPVKMNYDDDSNTQSPIVHGVAVVLSTVKYLSIKRPLVFYGIPGAVAIAIAMGFWVLCFQYFAANRTLPTNQTLVAVFMTVVGLVLLTTAVLLWVLIAVLRESRK